MSGAVAGGCCQALSARGHHEHGGRDTKNVQDFEEMNRAYVEIMGDNRPSRTVIGVSDLPKPGFALTMNLIAITAE